MVIGSPTSLTRSRGHGRVHRWCVRLLAAVVAMGVSPAFTQDATEAAIKSALIFNFARFTSWPPDALPAKADLVACVIATNNDFSQAMQRAATNRSVDGHSMVVKTLDWRTPAAAFRACHLVYAAGGDPKQLATLVADLRGAPVLTIIDVEDRSRPMGIMDVFVENGGLRFQVDNGLAKQGRLELSSRLLSVATGVRDNARSTR